MARRRPVAPPRSSRSAAATAWPPRCRRCGMFCDDLTAVVTVADNGGSSGRLRERVRRAAAGRPAEGAGGAVPRRRVGPHLGEVLQHRFESAGEMHDHAVGNLLIVALWELLGRPRRGVSTGSAGCSVPRAGCCRWRPCRSTSRPRSAAPTRRTRRASATVRGQVEVATTPGQVESVRARPGRPAGLPGGGRRRSVTADWVMMGPGSWYTSVLPAPAGSRACAHALDRDQRPACGDTQPGSPARGDRGAIPADLSGGARPCMRRTSHRRGAGGRARSVGDRGPMLERGRGGYGAGWCWRTSRPRTGRPTRPPEARGGLRGDHAMTCGARGLLRRTSALPSMERGRIGLMAMTHR